MLKAWTMGLGGAKPENAEATSNANHESTNKREEFKNQMILTPSKLIFDSNYKSDFKNAAELNTQPDPTLKREISI